MTSTSRAAATAVLLVLITACASREQRDETAVPESMVIEAFNDHFYDARIHAVYTGGQRRSLGTVPGNGGSTRTVLAWEPHALVFEVSFIIGGAEYVSLPVEVSPGEHVEVRLPPNIEQSGFFRRITRR